MSGLKKDKETPELVSDTLIKVENTKDILETPLEEPVKTVSVEESPVKTLEAPVEEALVEEAPVEEAPVEEAPVEESNNILNITSEPLVILEEMQ